MIDPAEQRPVGATGARISRLGIGGGSSFGRATVAPEDLVDACWDAGLRYFDTAPLYGGGESERRFGRALARYPRDHFTVSTRSDVTASAPSTTARTAYGNRYLRASTGWASRTSTW